MRAWRVTWGATEHKITIFDVSCRAAGHTGDILLCFDDVTEVEKAGQMRRDFVAQRQP